MTPQEKQKQQTLADKLRSQDPFKVDPAMVKDPKKLREKQEKGFPTIMAEAPDYSA